VKTSRGGAWPNQVSIPPGSPGCAWQETVAGVEKKFSAGCEHRSDAVESIKDMSIGTDGIDWVSSLLS